MPPKPQDDKGLDLKRMFAAIDPERVRKEDFTSAFTTVAKIIKELKQFLVTKTQEINTAVQTAIARIHTESTQAQARLEAAVTAKLAEVQDGKDGLNGLDGENPDPEQVTQEVLSRIKLPEYRAPMMDGPDEIRNKLELLQDDDRLDISAIKGVDKIEEEIKSVRSARVIAGAKGFMLMIGGAKKLLTAQTLNLVAGSGITLSYAYKNGRNDVTITASGSASLTPIAMTGTINDSNKSFTAASAPTLVIVNGAAYRNGAGVTISGTTITLDNPVGTGGDLYGL